MSPDLLPTKLKEIDDDAREKRLAVAAEKKRRQAAATFIVELIESREDELKEVLLIEPHEETDADEILYNTVTSILEELTERYTRVAGVVLYRLAPQDIDKTAHPAVEAGWAEFKPALRGVEDAPQDQDYPFLLLPNEVGVEVINNYRSAQGLVSLDEQRSANAKRLEIR